jgi:Holliday junction resolvasome RuvABC endonuclease subunit
MRRIFGIDYDTYQITVFELDLDDPNHVEHFVVGDPKKRAKTGKQADARLVDLRDGFRRLVLSRTPVAFAYVEEPVAVPRGVNTTIRQSAVWAAIRLVMNDEDVRCVSVNVSTWKKEALLNGRATKDEIKDWAVAVFDLSTDLPQDVYDAAGIAAAARKSMR